MTETEQAIAEATASALVALQLRDRLWDGPAALRLSLKELALALDVSRQTAKRLLERGLPYRRSALGDYVVIAGEAREWLARQERLPDVVPIRRRA